MIQFRSILWLSNIPLWGFPDGSAVKNPPASVGDMGSILGSGGSLEKETATHSSILASEIPRTEESGRLFTKESDMT